ncbi:MAG: tetratricopeptide repeat protein [Rhodothermia bacterium]|nr:tetratricopeptide repeat protein [Rhodothermia bacterium]
MSTLKPTKKISRRQELRQDTVVTFSARVWDFVDKNRSIAYGVLGAIVLVVVGILGYQYLQAQRTAEAQEFLAPAVRLYEQGNYREALDGVGLQMGLTAIADEFGSTNAGNLAHFYAADALFRLGELDQALMHFEAFEKDANYLGASALAGEAAVHEARGDYDEAGSLYKRAATIFPNDLVSPGYLMDAGRAYEYDGDFEEAIETYRLIADEYPESPQAREVDMLVARAEAKRESRS